MIKPEGVGVSTVLVTGGAGYIGSHTAKLLRKEGFQPLVFDNLSTGHLWAAQGQPVVIGDLCDRALLAHVMRKHRVQSVVHFAASAYVNESLSHPGKYFQNNVVNTLSLLDAMLDAGVDKLVVSSTCAVYGVPGRLPVSENQPAVPVSPYGESKLFIERALNWYGNAHGLKWVALRYFNAAGADPEGVLGEEHHPETHLIPSTILAALGRQPSLEVHGTDHPTFDGTTVRDFTHVNDLGEAHGSALRYLYNDGESLAMNLGTGRGYSIREVIRIVERTLGKQVPVKYGPARIGDPPELVADNSLARRLLAWEPRHSSLETIVETAANWFSSPFYVHAGARDQDAVATRRSAGAD